MCLQHIQHVTAQIWRLEVCTEVKPEEKGILESLLTAACLPCLSLSAESCLMDLYDHLISQSFFPHEFQQSFSVQLSLFTLEINFIINQWIKSDFSALETTSWFIVICLFLVFEKLRDSGKTLLSSLCGLINWVSTPLHAFLFSLLNNKLKLQLLLAHSL